MVNKGSIVAHTISPTGFLENYDLSRKHMFGGFRSKAIGVNKGSIRGQ